MHPFHNLSPFVLASLIPQNVFFQLYCFPLMADLVGYCTCTIGHKELVLS
jgi:hypothetical protein